MAKTWIYKDNVDTDVIIPARYLNTTDEKELASHCMEDIDKDKDCTGKEYKTTAYTGSIKELIECGGLINYTKSKLGIK